MAVALDLADICVQEHCLPPQGECPSHRLLVDLGVLASTFFIYSGLGPEQMPSHQLLSGVPGEDQSFRPLCGIFRRGLVAIGI